MCVGMYVSAGLYIFILPLKSKSYHLQTTLSILLSLLFFFIVLPFFGVQTDSSPDNRIAF